MFKKNIIVILLLLSGSVLFNNMYAVISFNKKDKRSKVSKEFTDSLTKDDKKKITVKPYNQIITKKAITNSGLFKVHKVEDKYYFEIPDSLLQREILIVNRISKASTRSDKNRIGYPGDQIGENIITFEKGTHGKLYMRSLSYLEYSNDTLGMYQAVKNSNIQPIVQVFDIKAFYKNPINNTSNTIIDITNLITSDNDLITFDPKIKKALRLGTFFADRSYIDTIKTYPINIEIKTVKTYSKSTSGTAVGIGSSKNPLLDESKGPFTYELNSSWVLLPEKPMKPRLFDPRVGYFAVRYVDFDSNPQGVDYKFKITRWRLEPKDEDIEKYKRGELVEPKNPIVFYIDPATPKKWVPYLIAGINDWQVAFECAGFKNAIYALEAPTEDEDPTWSLEDARHSAIVYKPSNIANASGPHVHDPRSGEIIESHINWYHNVMQLLHSWYMVQAGAIDPRARKATFDDELMGQLIRFVSSHEVGHTLGLRHNFGSSATVPVENLRNKSWVEANGHTPSIMDYARFNYVAQPEDSITEKGIFPRIGVYDKWAIEWGYRYLPQYDTAEDEIPYSNKVIIEKLNSDKRYTFGVERSADDPRNQSEDLGDNAMLAGMYGINNLKRIVPNILEWSNEPNKDYQNAANLYKEVVAQYNRYVTHVAKNVGGIYHTPRTIEEQGVSDEFVPAAIQCEAVKFLNESLFDTPTWLVDKKLIEKAGVDPITSIGNIQYTILSQLVNKRTIDKLTRGELYNGENAYTSSNMFSDLKKVIWSGLNTGKRTDIYTRNLQKNYVLLLINMLDLNKTGQSQSAVLTPKITSNPSDAPIIAKIQLTILRRDLKNAITYASEMERYHYQNLISIIDFAFDNK